MEKKTKTYKFQGQEFKLADPLIGRFRRIMEADNSNLETMFESFKTTLVGPVEKLKFDEMDIRDINQVILDFLALANPTAAKEMQSYLGLRPEKVS